MGEGHIAGSLCVAALLWTGCAGGPSEAERAEQAHLARIRSEGEALQRSLDGLEVRLLADQSRVQLWQTLARRHRHVTAVATVQTQAQLRSMLKWMKRQQRRMRAMRRRRVAVVDLFDLGASRRRRPHGRHRK